jgi:bifunctional polynucleotide phosphatase/kinase
MSCVEQTKGKYIAKKKDGSYARKGPPYPANECCGEIKKGNNGMMYKSVKNKKEVCVWKKIKIKKENKPKPKKNKEELNQKILNLEKEKIDLSNKLKQYLDKSAKKKSPKKKSPKKKSPKKKSPKNQNVKNNYWLNHDTIYYKLNIKLIKKNNCCFDYDDTLAFLRTSNPRPNVIKTLQKLALDNNIIVFSNQKGVSSGKSTNEEVQSLMDKFCEKVNIPICIFYSTTDDEYRKPMIGMFNFAKTIFEKTKFKFYCGDAAGRPNDFSISDLYFANNANINFKTPEEIFDNRKNMKIATKKIKDLYKDDIWINGLLTNKRKILNYYTLSDLVKLLPNFDTDKNNYLIINIGPQGSGKSTVAKFLSSKYDFGIISRDQLKTASKMNKAFTNFKKSKKGIIIDNTNPTKKNRDLWSDKLKNEKNWKIIKIFIDIPKLLSFHLTRYRMFFGGAKIPSVAIHTYYKRLDLNNQLDGTIVLNKPIIDYKFNHNLRFVWR